MGERTHQISEREIGARVRLRNESASRRQSLGAREQRADRGSERESAHKPELDERERRAERAGLDWCPSIALAFEMQAWYPSLVSVNSVPW